ncbi:MAG TPA: hypothetical protein VD836_11485, partial [Solirubrobacteraceae bacterium]|nr:hypothetical protein [Solirubrobacteraceae bacterium]
LLEEAATSAGGPETVRYALEEIAPHVGPEQAGRALDLALRMPYFWAWLGTVAALAPALSSQQAERAFEAVAALPTPDRLPVLAALVPRLDPERRAAAGLDLRATLAGLPPEQVLQVATILAQGLSEQERGDALGLALHAGHAAVDSPSEGRPPLPVMESLIGLVTIAGPAQEDVAGMALRHAGTLAPWIQGPMVVRLAAVLPNELRASALALAASHAHDADEPWRVLADIAALRSGDERADAEQAAVAAAHAVTDDAARLEAMTVIYERLPHLMPQPSPGPGGPGRTVMEMADEIVAEIPPGDRVAVITDAFYAHAGARPAMAPPAEQPTAAPSAQEPAGAPPPEEDLDELADEALPDLDDFEFELRSEHSGPLPSPALDEEWLDELDDIEPPAAPSSSRHRFPPRILGKPRAGRRASKLSRRAPRVPVVNTGFARPDAPDDPLSPRRPLAPRRTYLFWLEVGEELARSIEERAVSLPRDLPEGARVAVVLSPVSDGVVVGDAIGELEVRANGWAAVSRHAATVASDRPRRLFFSVRIDDPRGEIALRCSIYRHQVVVQSRLIRARVAGRIGRALPRRTPALVSTLDYALARTLDPPVLAHVPEHRVSLMVNGDGATHAMQLVAANGEAPDVHAATFEGGELQDLVTQTRGALRRAAWDTEDPWEEGRAYRYTGPSDLQRLERDLVRMAVRGYRFYDACINRLAGGFEAVAKLEEKLRRPGRIQIANRRQAGLVLPAAMFYDQPLDTGLETLGLCPEFRAALDAELPLERSRCFEGDCPSHGDLGVVCPSGFWGFRHFLGLPLSLGEEPAGDAAVFETIEVVGRPEISLAVSTDPMFVGRADHEARLRALGADLTWQYADTREETLRLLRESPGHVVYFYCHGGLTATNVPYLTVGPPGEAGIPSDIFRAMRIRWTRPRPLVFINGCHTTALSPEQALNFPARLVENAAAAGVIGTEITNFEPLASAFAEECLRRFLSGESIGEAVRGARLALLARGNPLGLIYVPFVLPSVRLARGSQSETR